MNLKEILKEWREYKEHHADQQVKALKKIAMWNKENKEGKNDASNPRKTFFSTATSFEDFLDYLSNKYPEE